MAFERQLYASGQRGVMQEPSGRARDQGSSLSLHATLQSLGIDVQRILHNAGNAAFTTLLALQLMLDPDTKVPTPKTKPPPAMAAMLRGSTRSPSVPPTIAFMPPTPVAFPPMGMMPAPSFPGAGGLAPEGFQGLDYGGNPRASFFPSQRSVSDHRLSVSPNVAMAHGGRLPGRARVSSMNDLSQPGVSEMGESFKSMHIRNSTVDSRINPSAG